ncbi:UNVERIFIED_CONTAM: Transposon Ty3-G Gag-Pol polyprotein [Sesamum radiatum]|uniref:Transposon Ty3-G Gag-Pol polyprotein n=1 Tax=Sesamum radiatum TaxID=300843 RepID=A0AAW2TU64_SESRA
MPRSSMVGKPEVNDPPRKGVIRMIVGGPIGGDSQKTRKAQVPEAYGTSIKEVLDVEPIEVTPPPIQFEQEEQRGHRTLGNDALNLKGPDPVVITHHLNLDPNIRPVKQKKRHFGLKKDKIIQEKVNRLLAAGHIREIQFPKLFSNIVLVLKPEGKWKMCIDFRDINKTCLKDFYPLSRIDQLVDSTSGCELISMMDASQGYRQKITFYYVAMPFRLKNAGATYQKLVDKIFRPQLGRNMEVYVDDVLVKSKVAHQHVEDFKETFAVLRNIS